VADIFEIIFENNFLRSIYPIEDLCFGDEGYRKVLKFSDLVALDCICTDFLSISFSYNYSRGL
jgi:hypothetical protein